MKHEDIKIVPLSTVPEYAPILAYWSYTQWYVNRDIEFSLILKSYKQRGLEDKLPVSYVAVSGSLPAGMVSIKENDLWSRKDLNPWLASLYVVPEYRNIGTGEKLVSAAIEGAKRFSDDSLFLFTGGDGGIDLDRYYKNRGWIFHDSDSDNDGNPANIYTYRLT